LSSRTFSTPLDLSDGILFVALEVDGHTA